MVKCLFCNKQFNKDKVPSVQIENRYAHQECYDKLSKEEKQQIQDKADFWQTIKELYGQKYNYMVINRQVEKLLKQGYTYKGIRLSLKWFHEVQKHPRDNEGIGIVPYVYNDAKQYYYNLFLSQQENSKVKDYVAAVHEVTIPSPKRHMRPPHLWLQKEDKDE